MPKKSRKIQEWEKITQDKTRCEQGYEQKMVHGKGLTKKNGMPICLRKCDTAANGDPKPVKHSYAGTAFERNSNGRCVQTDGYKTALCNNKVYRGKQYEELRLRDREVDVFGKKKLIKASRKCLQKCEGERNPITSRCTKKRKTPPRDPSSSSSSSSPDPANVWAAGSAQETEALELLKEVSEDFHSPRPMKTKSKIPADKPYRYWTEAEKNRVLRILPPSTRKLSPAQLLDAKRQTWIKYEKISKISETKKNELKNDALEEMLSSIKQDFLQELSKDLYKRTKDKMYDKYIETIVKSLKQCNWGSASSSEITWDTLKSVDDAVHDPKKSELFTFNKESKLPLPVDKIATLGDGSCLIHSILQATSPKYRSSKNKGETAIAFRKEHLSMYKHHPEWLQTGSLNRLCFNFRFNAVVYVDGDENGSAINFFIHHDGEDNLIGEIPNNMENLPFLFIVNDQNTHYSTGIFKGSSVGNLATMRAFMQKLLECGVPFSVSNTSNQGGWEDETSIIEGSSRARRSSRKR